jgi:4-hydroxybenzoate polyprenyltransferase
MNRWLIYQRERFPLLAHAPLVAAFSFSAVSFSALLRGPDAVPTWRGFLVAFVTSLLAFLQLRIADEFKDFDEDATFRSYRPVPRGLVTLRELGWIGVGAAIVQLALAWWLEPTLIIFLLLTWGYLALMSREFFAREWLKARPLTYLWSHMLIMPLIDLYATACDWRLAQEEIPRGLLWFLVISFFNGVVIEFGRKIRAPEDEENGVPTYTALWGQRKAVIAWLIALTLTAISATVAASLIGFTIPVLLVLAFLLVRAVLISRSFLQHPTRRHTRMFEMQSGVWTLCMYLTLGGLPMLWRLVR